jgi:glycolate oxidase
MLQKNFYSEQELKLHLQSGAPTLYHSSQTSTVIPFEKLEKELNPGTILGNLSMLKGAVSLDEHKNLVVQNFVTWKEAKEFCRANGREVMTSPTDEMAGVLSGVATSCTGERSFGFGNLRSQILEVIYLDFEGNEKKLSGEKKLELGVDFAAYRQDFLKFKNFKNAPYPRFEVESDLMTGTEGQLGVIKQVTLKTIEYVEATYLFLLLPKWEDDYFPHLEIFKAVQTFRGKIRACEIIDSNSIAYLPIEKRVGKNQDVVFLEIAKNNFEEIYELLLSKLKLIEEENIFEMDTSRCRDLRMTVPRVIFEENSRMGVTKKGTDVQVRAEDFEKLLSFYRSFTKHNIAYNLFGHFGDAHLHFNFMPNNERESFCNLELQRLYEQVSAWHGSPFAEHGIGLIKKKFIAPFYNIHQKNIFKELKKKLDPRSQFFPEGFMSC